MNGTGPLLAWPQRYYMAEAKAHIDMGALCLNGCDPKICGLIAIKWLRKALTA